MKQFSVLAVAALLSSLSAAAPLQHRNIVWVTDIVDIIETVEVVKTVWVDGPVPSTHITADAPDVTSSAAHKAHKPKHSHAASAPAQASVAPSSQAPAAAPAPAPSSTQAPTSAPAAAPAPAPSSVAPAPVVSSAAPVTAPAPATSSAAAAPAAAPAPVSSSPPVVPAAASSPSGTVYTGSITHYTPGLGSCGWTNGPSDYIVAIPSAMMSAEGVANPNDNPLCGKMITISYGGKQVQAKVVDTCPGCGVDSLDLTDSLFENFAPLAQGIVPGVEWWYT